MKTLRAWCLSLLMLVAALCPPVALSEEAQSNTLRIATANEESIVIDRILYTALSRMGYEAVVSPMGMKTAIMSVNDGENDLLAAQSLGLEDEYENLVPVNVPISYVDMVVYARADFAGRPASWDALRGLRVLYSPRNPYVDSHIPPGAVRVPVNDQSKLFDALLAGRGDVMVVPDTELSHRVVPPGAVALGVIEQMPTYTYVNRDKADLGARLAQEYQKMIESGALDLIKGNVRFDGAGDKSVLHISSYNAEMRWESLLVRGVQDALAGQSVTYYNLALNLRRLGNVQAQYDLMEKAVRATFMKQPPDLVLVSDNNALEFVSERYGLLFKGIPVVYCGINNFHADMLHGLQNPVGVEEKVSVAQTVEMMHKLFPAVKHIYMLNDYSLTGALNSLAIHQDVTPLTAGVSIHYNRDLPIGDVLDDIRSLGDNTLVLVGSYYTDGTGKYFSEQELAQVLATLNMPIFTLNSADMGYGQIIGGKVNDGYKQGYAAGQLAVQLLKGTPIGQLDAGDDDLSTWTFDYKAMGKFGLSADKLPQGHVALNKELSLFESNPVEASLLTSLLALLLLVALVFVVFSTMLRRRNRALMETQKSLHTAEEMLEKDDAIRRSREDLYTLLNSVMQPVMVVDLDGRNLLYANDAYVSTFGFHSREEALDHGIAYISMPDQEGGDAAALIERRHQDILDNKEVPPFEWNFISLSGRQVFGRVLIKHIVFNDRAAYAAVIQDITADRDKNLMLEKAAQLEKEANALKSQFVVNMSHELRTPMNAIIGLSQIALRKGFDADAHELFFKINRSGKLLLELINDVLDFSKIEAQKVELVEERFELEAMLSDVMMVAVPRIQSKPVQLTLTVDPRLPQYLVGDRTRVWQVLKNILDNSAKFTQSGFISLEAALSGGAATGGAAIAFCVRDTGIGMTREQLDKLYNPFEQFAPAAATALGTGLGMTITKQLVQLMRGSIHVDSAPGQGTQTTVVLPLAAPGGAPAIRDQLAQLALAGRRVYLVGADDCAARAFTVLQGAMGFALERMDDLHQAARRAAGPNGILVAHIDSARALDAPLSGPGPRLVLMPIYRAALTPSEIRHMGFDGALDAPILLTQAGEKLYQVANGLAEQAKVAHQDKYPGARVLLVEDNEINQEVAASMLGFYDIQPVIAANGREAIDKLEQQRFDLVFMDLLMPVMGGHEATRVIRGSDKPYRDVPIVAMTANVVKEEIELCFKNGMNDHIGKPVSVDVLRDKLRKWL